MTGRIKTIGMWAQINRRLLNLSRKRHGTLIQISQPFSSSNDSSDSNDSKTIKKHPIKDIPDDQIKKSVFISQSHDIFTNLALEDWLYRNFDFTTHHILMLWTNDPCVVIGRHQNP